MNTYVFEKEKLERLISDFYVSTNIAAVLYDSSGDAVASSPMHTDFCACIRQNAKCVAECSHSNFSHMEEAKREKKTVFYTCHAGLMEVITPIFYEDVLIAYLQIGQFRDAEGVFSNANILAKKAKNHGFQPSTLTALYQSVPVVSKEKLQALQNLLNALVKSFWSEGLISKNRSMLSVKMERYIDEKLSEPIRIDELCAKFSLSKNALYNVFQTQFGIPVYEFILLLRIRRAKRLLGETDGTITEIAHQCGFDDYNYFIRVFKKKSGVTPLQYRKSCR